MNQVFKGDLDVARLVFESFMANSQSLSAQFWLLVSDGSATAEDKDSKDLELLQQRYNAIEASKHELDEHLAKLKSALTVVIGVDAFGVEKKMLDRERKAWVNWLSFVSNSTMLGLQGLYAQFLFAHQTQLFQDQTYPMSERFQKYHELLRTESPGHGQVSAASTRV